MSRKVHLARAAKGKVDYRETGNDSNSDPEIGRVECEEDDLEYKPSRTLLVEMESEESIIEQEISGIGTERVDETVRSAVVSREASTSDVGPASSGEVTGSEFLAFMRHFNSMITGSGSSLNKTQLVSNIQPYRDGNDIVMYIKALEADMIRIGVRKKEWLSVLLSKLSSKAKMSVASVSCDPDCTYQDVKAKLLDGVGMDLKVVETSLMEIAV